MLKEEGKPRKRLKSSTEFHSTRSLRALLPNGTSISIPIDGVKHTSISSLLKEMEGIKVSSSTGVRKVEWGCSVYVEDMLGSQIDDIQDLYARMEKGLSIILVQDGHPQSQHFDKDLWNVTPEPEMLGRLPQGYNLETALADQVDNALQAVWDNKDNRRLVCVEILPGKITIFDTGLGMDASEENSIAKWGTVGASTHRNVHHLGIGGKPPFLKPYLGKYGAGGVAAALHLGGKVVVSSKTKLSKKVVSLVIEKEILVEKHQNNRNREESNARIWRTDGEFREMTGEEKEKSPHGSFTCVEITKLKRQYFFEGGQQYWRVAHLRQLLKDIYALYIQSDQIGKTSGTLTPVEFRVNGVSLTEELGGEITLLNQYSCNGEPFVIDLHLKKEADEQEKHRKSHQNPSLEVANAQITCHYYPNLRGKEQLQTVLDKMEYLQPTYTFETMPRVGIRWLGRLLPETKWLSLPFMEVLPKKEKQGIRRQWGKRVRAFVDSDAGFHPTQSKTALEKDHPFTVALQSLGYPLDKLLTTSASGVEVNILRKGREISLTQLVEEYACWLKYNHENYDEEVTFDDDPVYVINQENLPELLDVSKSVVVFHRHMCGMSSGWKANGPSPLRVKLAKGLTGTRHDLYATIEYFFYDGTEEDHGEVKMVCRPLGISELEGSKLEERKGSCYFQLNKSICFPVTHLNSDKCQCLTEEEWNRKLNEIENRHPGYIEILNEEESHHFDIDQALPESGETFEAGYHLPQCFLVVIRPRQGSGHKLKQGMIVAENLEMKLSLSFLPAKERTRSREAEANILVEVTVHANFSKPGVKGLYCFNIHDLKIPEQLTCSGCYTFQFSLINENYKNVKHASCAINIIPSASTCKWSICSHVGDCDSVHPNAILRPIFRLEETLDKSLFLSKYDEYDNQQMFEGPLELKVSVSTAKGKSLHIKAIFQRDSISLTADKLFAKIANMSLAGGKLFTVAGEYNAVLRFYLPNDKRVDLHVKVLPGKLSEVHVKESYPKVSGSPLFFKEALKPSDTIGKLVLQGYDQFGNIVEKGQTLRLELDGLELLDKALVKQVDSDGCVQLDGLVRVTAHFNSKGCLLVFAENGSKLLQLSFRVEMRSLRFVKEVPTRCYIGRQLEALEVEIIDENGVVDKCIEGPLDALALSWTNSITCPFRSGRCSLPAIEMPKAPGLWIGAISHSFNTALKLELQVELELAFATKIANSPSIESEEKIWEARSGEAFKLPIIALDDYDQPALIPEGFLMQFSMNIKPQSVECGYGDIQIDHCKPQRDAHANCYEVEVTISGHEASYNVYAELLDSSSACNSIGLGPLCWLVNLHAGVAVRLVPVISKEKWLSHELKEAIDDPISSILVPRHSFFPVLDVYLLDSAQNICSLYEGCQIRLDMPNSGELCHKLTSIINGYGRFGTFKLDLVIGLYELKLVAFLHTASGQPCSLTAEIQLQVTVGNYPSALKLLVDQPVICTLLENDVQYLPVMKLLVESADKQALKKELVPILRFTVGSENKEYVGDFVEVHQGNAKITSQEVTDHESCLGIGSIYSFQHVHTPSISGTYSLTFSLPNVEIPRVALTLIVKNGPPSKIEFFEEQHGHELHTLKVRVVDAHGNHCPELHGIRLHAELVPTNGRVEQQENGSCILLSSMAAMVVNGEADFGEVHLGKGMEGMYCLRVLLKDNSLNLAAASSQLVAIRGKTMHQHFNQLKQRAKQFIELVEHSNKFKRQLQFEDEKKASLELSVTDLQEKLRRTFEQHKEVEMHIKNFLDDEILARESSQDCRSEEDVIADFREQASRGNGVPLALWEARLSRNFLSLSSGNAAAADVIGQVVMLARVEGNSLNRILSEYIGQSLLMIVCKSQEGICALEAYDGAGNVDETKGLYGFAHSRGYKISGRYQAVCLNDIRPYRHPNGQDSVELQHCQKLLRIPPPVNSSGGHPTGFLGHAVNLLHLKQEHLNINVKGQIISLRETLFFSLFLTLQVYDTRKNLYLAKESCKQLVGGAVSLDGAIIRNNNRQELGKRRDKVPVSFPLVPMEERMELSLLPPACFAFERRKVQRKLLGDLNDLQKRLSSELNNLDHINNVITEVKKNLEMLEIQGNEIKKKTQQLNAELESYQKAAKSVQCLDSHEDDTNRIHIFMV